MYSATLVDARPTQQHTEWASSTWVHCLLPCHGTHSSTQQRAWLCTAAGRTAGVTTAAPIKPAIRVIGVLAPLELPTPGKGQHGHQTATWRQAHAHTRNPSTTTIFSLCERAPQSLGRTAKPTKPSVYHTRVRDDRSGISRVT